MSPKTRNVLTIAAPIVLVAGVILGIVLWPRSHPVESTEQGEWTCSMHPQVRKPAPGKCPICGMNLIPVERLSAEQERIEQAAGVETESVAYRELVKEIRTVGKLDFNESQMKFISARINGRVDRLYADFTGVQVKKGDHLVDIYSPELVIAQTELMRALEGAARTEGDRTFADANLEAVRTKLRLLGILPEQVAEMERSKKVSTHLTVFAPIGGTVIEKSVRAGQYVKEGDPLYRIADLDPIWLYLDVYEFDLGWIRHGQTVDVKLEAYPNEAFRGVVTFIDPFLDDKSRTLRVRVNLKNPDKKLKPAMYATATIRVALRADGSPQATGLEGKYICPMHPEVIRDESGKCPICEMALEKVPALSPLGTAAHEGHENHEHGALPVPGPKDDSLKPNQVLAIRTSAVLSTGRRTTVYRKRDDGAFELIDVKLGQRADGKDDAGLPVAYYPVFSGLRAGDRVAVRGGFLLDSQRQIEGMPSLLYPKGQAAANLHSGHGGTAPIPAAVAPNSEHKH